MDWVGRYINLDRSTDRRAEIEGELARFGLSERYARFGGIDGRSSPEFPDIRDRGALGCTLSHLALIRSHAVAGNWLHILEDDALLSRFVSVALDAVTSDPSYERYDLVFTSAALLASAPQMAMIRQIFDRNVSTSASGAVESVKYISAVELSDIDFRQTTSYLVSPAAIRKVERLLAEHLTADTFAPIDLLYSRLAQRGELSAACIVPFVTVPRLGTESTITSGNDVWESPLRIMDRALYVDRDVAALDRMLSEMEASADAGVTAELICRAQRLLISGSRG